MNDSNRGHREAITAGAKAGHYTLPQAIHDAAEKEANVTKELVAIREERFTSLTRINCPQKSSMPSSRPMGR